MTIILLSGGSGRRLWPLSNEVRSKQFIRILKHEKDYESMVQRVYRQIKMVDKDANIILATSQSQVSAIKNQLGNNVSICVEPCRRDTFPAIALASKFLSDEKSISPDESVIVCPVDSYVDSSYFESLKKLSTIIENDECNLALLGIKPTYPSEKYGYIMPEKNTFVSKVKSFKEKPDEKTAELYIKDGALWNGGVFAFKLGYLLEKTKEIYGNKNYKDLYNGYHKLEKISFDYALVEKEESIFVLQSETAWKDVGTWNTFCEVMHENTFGKVVCDKNCENTHVINELNVPVLCMGLKNVVVAACSDGIIVSDKHESSYIKPHVESFDQQIMFAEKSWGSFRVLDVQKGSMTIKVVLKEGNELHYHSHELRDEVWTVVKGRGVAIIDEEETTLKPGAIVSLPRGSKHMLKAFSDIEIIEVQMGSEIAVEDKKIWE